MIRTREIDFSNVVKTNMSRTEHIKEDIENLVRQLAFELPTKENRKIMCDIIGNYLGEEIIDRTTDKMVDDGTYFFLVRIGNKEYPLISYIENIVTIDRKKKILKLKSKL